jgi:hypothetical protein
MAWSLERNRAADCGERCEVASAIAQGEFLMVTMPGALPPVRQVNSSSVLSARNSNNALQLFDEPKRNAERTNAELRGNDHSKDYEPGAA